MRHSVLSDEQNQPSTSSVMTREPDYCRRYGSYRFKVARAHSNPIIHPATPNKISYMITRINKNINISLIKSQPVHV